MGSVLGVEAVNAILVLKPLVRFFSLLLSIQHSHIHSPIIAEHYEGLAGQDSKALSDSQYQGKHPS